MLMIGTKQPYTRWGIGFGTSPRRVKETLMDKKIVGLVGAISGLVSLSAAHAAPITPPSETEVSGAKSYAELLDPIPNALSLLRVADAAAAAGG